MAERAKAKKAKKAADKSVPAGQLNGEQQPPIEQRPEQPAEQPQQEQPAKSKRAKKS